MDHGRSRTEWTAFNTENKVLDKVIQMNGNGRIGKIKDNAKTK